MGDLNTDTPSSMGKSSLHRIEASRKARSLHFIRGPIPMPWLERAAALPGKALAVALLLWFQHGITKRLTVSVKPGLLKRFCVGRKAGYSAVNALEAAGLVTADRHRGKAAIVTIIKAAGEAE